MKTMLKTCCLTLALALTAACSSSLETQTQQTADVNLAQYASFEIQPGYIEMPMNNDDISREMFKQETESSIEAQLESFGLEETMTDPAMRVVYQFDVLTDVNVREEMDPMYYYGYDYYYYYPYTTAVDPYDPDLDGNDVTVTTDQVGQLVLRIKDTDRNQVVWTGAASDILADGIGTNVKERIDNAVGQLLGKFYEQRLDDKNHMKQTNQFNDAGS